MAEHLRIGEVAQAVGVSVDTLLDAAGPKPEATHVMARSTTGYTTDLPLEHLRGGKAWWSGRSTVRRWPATTA